MGGHGWRGDGGKFLISIKYKRTLITKPNISYTKLTEIQAWLLVVMLSKFAGKNFGSKCCIEPASAHISF